MKTHIGTLLGLLVLTGCTHNQITWYSDHPPKWYGVRTVKAEADITGCELKGAVKDDGTLITPTGAVLYGGLGFATAGSNRIVQREDQVGELGGNTLYDREFENGDDLYQAYLCPGFPMPTKTAPAQTQAQKDWAKMHGQEAMR
jgi:hypothetical protein